MTITPMIIIPRVLKTELYGDQGRDKIVYRSLNKLCDKAILVRKRSTLNLPAITQQSIQR